MDLIKNIFLLKVNYKWGDHTEEIMEVEMKLHLKYDEFSPARKKVLEKKGSLNDYFCHPLIHKQIHGNQTYVELDKQRLGFHQGR